MANRSISILYFNILVCKLEIMESISFMRIENDSFLQFVLRNVIEMIQTVELTKKLPRHQSCSDIYCKITKMRHLSK